ncbi:MAG: efflux RND transporter periplasmic adaptor subunit [Pseudomonadota bacterium]
MRLFSIFAAIVVGALIYGFVLERDQIAALFAADGPAEATASIGADGEDVPTEGDSAAKVRVVAVRSTARRVDTSVVVRGQTEADRQVELLAQTTGQVISDPLKKGAFVEAGEILCRLDPGTRDANLAEAVARLAEARAQVPSAEAQVPSAQAAVEEARARVLEANARLREAQINSNAASRLSEEGFASQTRVAQTAAEVEGARAQIVSAEAGLKAAQSGLESAAAGIEAARAGVESAQAAVASAKKEIDNLTISAPFSGLLESDTAELGSLLQTGGLCATVIRLDPMVLVGFVNETQVNQVKTGAAAVAELSSRDQVEGKVVFVSRAADETTRTFRVEIEVPNPDYLLRDGQTAEIRIEAEGQEAHLLPQSALTLNDDGMLGVRVVSAASQAEFVPVRLLRDTPTGVLITGLPDSANVIIIGQEFVGDGVPVEPSFQELSQ